METPHDPEKRSAPHTPASPRTVLPGSEKAPFVQTTGEKPAPSGAKLTVSVVVKRKAPLKAANRTGKERLTHAQYRKNHGADPDTVKLVRAFAKEYGLTVAPDTPGPERRAVKLVGTVAAMQKAFGVTLATDSQGVTYRVREGSIVCPPNSSAPSRPSWASTTAPRHTPTFASSAKPETSAEKLAQSGGFAKPHASRGKTSYSPPQVAALYQFPSSASGAGQTIGIIELGGGYKTTDLATYFKSLGKRPHYLRRLVDGGKNAPSNANSADGEVMLDIEVAASVAPGANIVVYFTPNTDQGFIDAIATAVHDTKTNPASSPSVGADPRPVGPPNP